MNFEQMLILQIHRRRSIAADCEIEFCLANTDPNGNSTSGITRTATSPIII